MRKISLFIMALVAALTFTATFAAAEDSIIETPNVRIVIDGEADSYTDVPLIVNDRTMLPLREVLVNLGVQNDDEHILWNGDEQSVTVVTEDKTIVLQVGSTTATVNGEAMTLDVAPMIYPENNRTYIPARFVSESLGKKVVWDGSTTTVLITDEERFNEVYEILEKSSNSEEADMTKFALDMDYLVRMDDGSGPTDMSMLLTSIFDMDNDAMYMDLTIAMELMPGVPMNIGMESYQIGLEQYSKSTFTGDTWSKTTLEEGQELSAAQDVSFDVDTFSVDANEIVAAGLVIVESDRDDQIVLEGNVYLEDMVMQTAGSYAGSDSDAMDAMDLNSYYITMILDSETYVVESMSLLMDMAVTDEYGMVTTMIADVDVTIEVLDEDFVLTVPDEVIENAVEDTF